MRNIENIGSSFIRRSYPGKGLALGVERATNPDPRAKLPRSQVATPFRRLVSAKTSFFTLRLIYG